MEIIQVSPTDSLAKKTVYDILNHSHDKRIKQKTLDFYRNGIEKFLSRNGVVIWLIGIDASSNKVGITGCAFGCKSKQVIHSITVVSPNFRKLGYGKMLLNAKLGILRKEYSKIKYRSYVSINNQPSIKMCAGVGLIITDEGSREREGKEPTSFFVFGSP